MKEHGIEVIPVVGVYSGGHIDSTLCLLNKKQLLFCSKRISAEKAHSMLKHCGFTDMAGYIPCYEEDMTDVGLFDASMEMSSVFIGMNLLAISEDTLVVEAKQEKLIAKLKGHGLKIVPVSYP